MFTPWNNNAGTKIGTSGTTAVTRSSSGLQAWKIGQNHSLINHEAMTVDAAGRAHVLLSHIPDAQANDATFDSARTKSQYFHYWRDPNGKWPRTAMVLPAVAAFRGKLAVASWGNLRKRPKGQRATRRRHRACQRAARARAPPR